MDTWRTFRKEYGKFHKLRNALPNSALVFGTSATISPSLRARILEKGPFKYGHTFINTTTDRPEVFIEIRRIESKPKSDLHDLRFLVPDRATDEEIGRLRKTIVFFDDRTDVRTAWHTIAGWLIDAGVSVARAVEATRPYYAILPDERKQELLQNFRDEDSPIRILLATDAIGMGIDLHGISVVVQYDGETQLKSSDQVTTIVQRMGRAARQFGEAGHFVWLVPEWTKFTEDEAQAVRHEEEFSDSVQGDSVSQTQFGSQSDGDPESQFGQQCGSQVSSQAQNNPSMGLSQRPLNPAIQRIMSQHSLASTSTSPRWKSRSRETRLSFAHCLKSSHALSMYCDISSLFIVLNRRVCRRFGDRRMVDARCRLFAESHGDESICIVGELD